MKKPATFTIDERLIDKLKKEKIKQGRNKSQIVERALAKDLKVKI